MSIQEFFEVEEMQQQQQAQTQTQAQPADPSEFYQWMGGNTVDVNAQSVQPPQVPQYQPPQPQQVQPPQTPQYQPPQVPQHPGGIYGAAVDRPINMSAGSADGAARLANTPVNPLTEYVKARQMAAAAAWVDRAVKAKGEAVEQAWDLAESAAETLPDLLKSVAIGALALGSGFLAAPLFDEFVVSRFVPAVVQWDGVTVNATKGASLGQQDYRIQYAARWRFFLASFILFGGLTLLWQPKTAKGQAFKAKFLMYGHLFLAPINGAWIIR